MNNNSKIHLTIYLESCTLVRQNEAEQIHYQVIEGNKLVKEGYINHKPLVSKGETTQHLNLSQEAYDYYVSSNCPHWINKGQWKNMGKTLRLKTHLQRLCEAVGGKSYNFQVLED